jgi:hypothetical protein
LAFRPHNAGIKVESSVDKPLISPSSDCQADILNNTQDVDKRVLKGRIAGKRKKTI